MNRGRFGRMEAPSLPDLPGPGVQARHRLLGEAFVWLEDNGPTGAAQRIGDVLDPLPLEGER